MRYITGKHALNINCSLDTCGDWHFHSMDWDNPLIQDTENSVFGDYGIELGKKVPNKAAPAAVANHIRALLDMLEAGNTIHAQGMKNGFIGNSKYTKELFDNVYKLKNSPHWDKIDKTMGKEYYGQWLRYKEGRNV